MQKKMMSSHFRIGLKLVASIGLTELIIMAVYRLLDVYSWMHPILIDLLDTLLLCVMASLLILYWVVNPMKILEEREKADKALHESEMRYRLLFENMLVGIAYCKMIFVEDQPKDFVYLAVNDAFETLTGLTDVVGKKVSKVIPGIQVSNPELFRIYGEVASTGKPQRLESYLNSLGIWFSITAYSPEKGYFVVVFDNITEHKRAEENLRMSEARLRTLVQAIPDLIWLKNTEGVYLACNAMFERFFGAAEADIIGKTDYDFVDRELADFFRQHDRKAMAAGKPSSNEEWITFADDGHRALLDTVKTPMFDAEGKLIGVLGVARDITERRKSEESVRKLSQAVEQSPVSIIITDAAGTIEFVNTKFTQITGYSYAEALDKNPRILKSGEASVEEYQRLWKTISSGGVWRGEFHNRKKNGELFWEYATIAPIRNTDNIITHYVAIKEDIAERKKLEEQLLHAQKMESIGTLAGGIAHDFNNILSAIIGFGHVTLMKMPKDDPLRINIERMLESADRAAVLTQSLLVFSRKQVTDRKPVDLNNVLKKVEKFLARVIGEDVVISMDLAEGALTVFADAGQLEQVFMNLATNARDAMPSGGSFMIETSIEELDIRFISAQVFGKPGTYAMISATDSGAGMNEETRNKIFEPFFTTKEAGKGTGLGLAMVYGIIKQHEGFINVYSEPGRGTTFRIYLPLIKSVAVDERSAVISEYPKGGTETILLAEDDENLRKLTVIVLEQMGYQVITANDGEDAVTKFRENTDSIQLLLFDIIMPKKNGREAYEEIRKVNPSVPVLFQSGYSPDMLREKALVEEGAAILYKPMSPQSLLKKVRELLDRR